MTEGKTKKRAPWYIWVLAFLSHALLGVLTWPEYWLLAAIIAGFFGTMLVAALTDLVNHSWGNFLLEMASWVICVLLCIGHPYGMI